MADTTVYFRKPVDNVPARIEKWIDLAEDGKPLVFFDELGRECWSASGDEAEIRGLLYNDGLSDRGVEVERMDQRSLYASGRSPPTKARRSTTRGLET